MIKLNKRLHLLLFAGIDDLKRSHSEKRYDEELGEFYYAEIEAGFSKNHRSDDEGNRDERGATIVFRTSPDGFNPGEFIENAEKFALKQNPHFFQRPRKPSKKFDIHNPEETTYFEMAKVGKHMVAEMLPKVCKLPILNFKNCTYFLKKKIFPTLCSSTLFFLCLNLVRNVGI